jgi:PTH1 family peptidyl-tRNA hydrolase
LPVTGAELPPVAETGPRRDALRPLVVCDDLALPLGAVRLRARGGSGGQNGLASLIERLGGEAFPRLRLGIAPEQATVPPEQWADYVLADFAPDELEAAAAAVAHAVAALEWWLEHGIEAAASRFNRRAGHAGTDG